ncbi:hypothetical protein CBW65_04990 [Tumebacillus avium]|uniref:SLAP domain-containing protein n=1 Tax=Tumebacillus avium TaxID=1903704 RepID=A0A1Y0IJ12_9BACL|nr:SLAP domain-containing protein [Tumebacillus avium]ARU60501.1 hypothetical protein CBW65_04990 [Tumebacillus avium]
MEQNRGGLFTRLFVRKTGDQIEVIEPQEVDEASIPTVGKTLPHTIIAFTPEQEQQYSEAEKERMQEQLLSLPPLHIGEVNVVPFDTGMYQGGCFVRVFIRNAWEVDEELTIEKMPLSLIDATGEIVARGTFTLKNFGSLRFGESRVWTFAWRENQLLKKTPDFSAFTVEVQ